MDSIGRGNLRGIDYAQTAARSGSQVENTASARDPLHDSVNQSLDLRDGSGHGDRHSPVFRVDRVQQFICGHFLKVIVP